MIYRDTVDNIRRRGGSGTNCLAANPISAHGGGWVILVATVSVRTLNVKKKRYFSGKITKIHVLRAKISKFCKNYYKFLSYFPNFKILLKNIK